MYLCKSIRHRVVVLLCYLVFAWRAPANVNVSKTLFVHVINVLDFHMLPYETSLLPSPRTCRSLKVFCIYLHRLLNISIIIRTINVLRFSLLMQAHGIVSHFINTKTLSTAFTVQTRTELNGGWRFFINNHVAFWGSIPNSHSRTDPDGYPSTRRDSFSRNFHRVWVRYQSIVIRIDSFDHARLCGVTMYLRVDARAGRTEANISGQENMRESYSEEDYNGFYIDLSHLVY